MSSIPLELWPEDVPAVLWPLDVSVLPGLGPKMRKRLEEMGIRSVGGLAARREEFLVSCPWQPWQRPLALRPRPGLQGT
ncbi:MAG: hypothetical protein H5U01_09060 [Clostridia bacterium]|nr:hypothetical protein [Clostridia bacterium]